MVKNMYEGLLEIIVETVNLMKKIIIVMIIERMFERIGVEQ